MGQRGPSDEATDTERCDACDEKEAADAAKASSSTLGLGAVDRSKRGMVLSAVGSHHVQLRVQENREVSAKVAIETRSPPPVKSGRARELSKLGRNRQFETL